MLQWLAVDQFRPVCGWGVPCISREVRSDEFFWSIIRCILQIRMLELYQMRQKWSIRPIFGSFRAETEDPYKLIFWISSNSKMNVFIELASIRGFKKWYWVSKLDSPISRYGDILPKIARFPGFWIQLQFFLGRNFLKDTGWMERTFDILFGNV